MKRSGAHIGTILSILILLASLLPALHVFDHEITSAGDLTHTQKAAKASLDCELCDFRFSGTDAPSLYEYDIFTPQQEAVHVISLAETVNLFQHPHFSLRAPPAVIS